MKIEIDPKDLLSRENFQMTKQAAREEGLPLEVYVFKTYDLLMTTGASTPINVNDTLVPQKVEIVHVKPPEQKAAPEQKEVYNAFDHLKLLDEGKAGTRAHNLLEDNFADVDAFICADPKEVLKIKGFGQKSLDLIVERLIAEGHIASAEELGAAPEEEDEDDESDDEEEEEEDFYDQLSALDPSGEDSIITACRIYMQAWNLEYAAAQVALKGILGESGYSKDDSDSIRFGLIAILDALPASDGQQAKVLSLGKELGEEETSTRERAIAMCGKEFDKLNYGEMRTLSEELGEDLDRTTVEVDDDFTF